MSWLNSAANFILSSQIIADYSIPFLGWFNAMPTRSMANFQVSKPDMETSPIMNRRGESEDSVASPSFYVPLLCNWWISKFQIASPHYVICFLFWVSASPCSLFLALLCGFFLFLFSFSLYYYTPPRILSFHCLFVSYLCHPFLFSFQQFTIVVWRSTEKRVGRTTTMSRS